MRIRNIRPNFFKNEELAQVPFETRLLFVGLWCMADCEGRLEDRPLRAKAELFPYDAVDVGPMLDALVALGFVLRYEVAGVRLLWIPAFRKHQIISKKERQAGSDLPPHPDDPGSARGGSRKPAGNRPTSTQPRPDTDPEPSRDHPGTVPGPSREATRADMDDGDRTTGIGRQGSDDGDRTTEIGEPEGPSPAGAGGPSPETLRIAAMAGPRGGGRKRRKATETVTSEVGARVLARLNELSGSNFRKSPELERLVREGVPEADLVAVVEAQAAREFMQRNSWEYFRPKTLFGPENFENYRGAVRRDVAPEAAPKGTPMFSEVEAIERQRLGVSENDLIAAEHARLRAELDAKKRAAGSQS